MPSRRNALRTVALAITGLAGCIADRQDESDTPPPTSSPTPPPGSPTPSEPPSDPADIQVAELSVADFILYALAGTHPHVHRRAGYQYVVVRLDGNVDFDRAREQLSLELDGEFAAFAERQPVPFANETLDVAFAIPKDRTTEAGTLLFGETTLQTLKTETIQRLNNPPVFEVTTPTVEPSEIQAGEQVEATVEFGLSNVGDGGGTFGASLKGNHVSGANTITRTLDAGTETTVSAAVSLVGNGDEARVRLDWGADEWVQTVPVVGTETA